MPVSKTHPWITFEVDLRKIQYNLWMKLGEVQSKCENLAGTPLHPDIQAKLYALYLAKGVRATTGIEGNTLTEEQVLKRIEGQLTLPPSQEYMGKEIDNLVKACNEVASQLIEGGTTNISVQEIKEFNRRVLKGLDLQEEVTPGEIRKCMVGVAGYRAVPPEHCEKLLNDMCFWLNKDTFKQKDNLIAFGILRAVLAHIYIAWIHPFGDGNGRTARLVEFKILLAHGVPFAAAHLLSNHYNSTRTDYYRQLDRLSKSSGDIIPFVEYAVNGLIDGLKEQLRVVKGQQIRIIWRDHVYNSFRNKSGYVNDRRRRLALDIADSIEPVSIKHIRRISTRIAELYATKTNRAVVRDISSLVEMKLLIKSSKGYLANWEIVKAFLPGRIIED